VEFLAKKIYRNKKNNQITINISKKDLKADIEIKNLISKKLPKRLLFRINKEDFE